VKLTTDIVIKPTKMLLPPVFPIFFLYYAYQSTYWAKQYTADRLALSLYYNVCRYELKQLAVGNRVSREYSQHNRFMHIILYSCSSVTSASSWSIAAPAPRRIFRSTVPQEWWINYYNRGTESIDFLLLPYRTAPSQRHCSPRALDYRSYTAVFPTRK